MASHTPSPLTMDQITEHPYTGYPHIESSSSSAPSESPSTIGVSLSGLSLVVKETGNKDEMTIADVAENLCPWSWEEIFEDAKPEIRAASQVIKNHEDNGHKFFPLKKDIFGAFNYCSLTDVKVVIIGQDPYPTEIQLDGQYLPRATGMSFSVRKGDDVPASLINIYKEVKVCYPDFVYPGHGDLSGWAVQGIMFLNMALTFRSGCKDSSQNVKIYGPVWSGFIKKVIKAICTVNPHCIFVLWGKPAQNIREYVADSCPVLESSHPSPLGARYGFIGCRHFSTINKMLEAQKKKPIDWNSL